MEGKVQAKTVFSGAIWRFAERILAQVVSFVVSIVLARLLLPEEYGIVSLTTIFITLCNVFVTSGFGVALVQKKDSDALDFSTILTFGLTTSLALYIGLFFIAPVLADFYNQPILTVVIRVMSLRLPIASINSVQQAYISKKMMFKKFFFATFLGTAVSAVLGIVLAIYGFGVWALVVQYLSNCLIDTLVLAIVVKKFPKLRFSWRRFKGVFGFGWRVLCSDFIATVYTQLRGLIIGKKYTTEQLAYYSKGDQIPHLFITNSNIAISSVLFPALSKVQDDKDRLLHIMKQSIKLCMYVFLPLMIGLVIIAEPLVKLLLTDKWLFTVPFLQLAAISYVIDPWIQINLQYIKAIGEGKSYLALEIVKKTIAFIILIASIPFGVYAIALSAIVYAVVSLLVTSIFVGKVSGYGFWKQLKDIFPDVIKVAIMFIAVFPLKYLGLNPYLLMGIQVVLGAGVYILVSILAKDGKLKYIIELVKNLLGKKEKPKDSLQVLQQRRKKNWLKNAIRYRWMKLFPGKRDKNLWVFSSWEGQKYADNAKYLFEYVLKNQPKINCVWQTKNPTVFNSLKELGIPVQMIGTKESILTQKKAGVAIYTNGLDDFGEKPFVYGAKIVSVWHGVGFKKPYRAQLQKSNKIKRFFSNCKWDFFSWVKRDLTIINSEYHKEQCVEGFHLNKKSKFALVGQARNDELKNKPTLEQIFSQDLCNLLYGKKIILYMPTFREDNTILIQNIEKLYSSKEFEDMLDKNNAIFLGKLHYLCRGNITSTKNCILLNDEDVVDTQKLFLIADLLITDYSSCAVDYALLQKPTMFFIPNDGYNVEKWLMPKTIEKCSICLATTEEECVVKIDELMNDKTQGIEQSNVLNEYFNEIIDVGNYSKRNFEAICEFVGIGDVK